MHAKSTVPRGPGKPPPLPPDPPEASLSKGLKALKIGDKINHVQFVTKACDLAEEAIQADIIFDHNNALSLYQNALQQFLKGLKYEQRMQVQGVIKNKITELMDRAEIIKNWLQDSGLLPSEEETGKRRDSGSGSGSVESELPKKGSADLGGMARSGSTRTLETKVTDCVSVNPKAFEEGVELIKQAIQAEDQQAFADALPLYEKGLSLLLTSIKTQKNVKIREATMEKVRTYMARAEELKLFLAKMKALS